METIHVASARQRLLAGIPMIERRRLLAGVSTSVLEGGEGRPVVLLHGPGEYAAKWQRVIPALTSRFRVIAPDLPGHGESDPFGAPPDIQRMLDWVKALIEATCRDAPCLVGQILGGAIAARYAGERRPALRCLVLSDTLGLAPFQPVPEFGRALNEFIAAPSEETHDRLWERCAFDLEALRVSLGERWEWIRAYNLDRARAPNLGATQLALMQHFGMPAIPAETLERIAVPTALVWGRHDLATPLAAAMQASMRYGWPLHIIENAGDDPPMEQPLAFMETLQGIFERVMAAS